MAIILTGFGVWASTKPTNLVVIMTDNHGAWTLGCYGNPDIRTPNIDRLATQGTLFTRAYCQQTVCNPSRASLLTGCRPDTLRVWDLPTHFRVHKPDAVTLPQMFKRNGYYAQGIGKIFHNWRQDDWKGDPASWSVPAVLHYNTHNNDTPQVEGEIPPNLATVAERTECRDVPDDAYYDGRVANKAIEALKEVSQKEEPFFLAVGFWKPHLPFNAPKKYWDLYDRKDIELPKVMTTPVDVPDIALTQDLIEGRYTKEEILELHHGHLAAISYLDTQVGKVLDELDSLGLRDNTIIVFWSDHGIHIGEHGLMRKTTLFELDAGVPLIITTPNHPKGQRANGLVELMDLYPTLADLCGLEPPNELEGISLVPILEDPTRILKEAAMTETARPNYPRGNDPEVLGYSIRTDRFRYNEWRDFKTGEIRARELYDHSKDPGETVNVVGDPQFATELDRLSKVMEETLPSTTPWSNTNAGG
ncbi:MAG: sulfatase [Candidatus Omnitrophica bacterium]|nr:sulfatase [Candidatus Omnitrophota bacterium]